MGENRHLPESELDIMLVVWGAGGPVSAPAILEGLERPLTASALHSYLKRLEEKGFLSCKKTGKVNTYTAMVAREDYQRSEGESFLKKLYGSSISRFAAALYDGKRVEPAELGGAPGTAGPPERGRGDMTALVERVVWVSLATSLLLLPLLGLSGAIRRRYRAGSCYLLWLVLALRLLIPLPVPVPVGTALCQVVPAPAAEETLVSLPGISGPASVRGPQAGGAGGAAELTEALSWLWAAGAVLFLGVEGGGYLRARRKILEGSQARAGDQAALEALGGTVPVAASRGGHPHDPGPAAPGDRAAAGGAGGGPAPDPAP